MIEQMNTKISANFHNIDLTVDMKPPKDLFIEVTSNDNYGNITLPDSGEITFNKGRSLFLRRSDVDQLIKKGMVKEC
jgi:GINS complex subunit 1